MLFKYLENVRREPYEVRKTHAIFITVTLTGMVVFVWLLGFLFNYLGTRDLRSEELGIVDEESKITTLFNNANSFMDEKASFTEFLDVDTTQWDGIDDSVETGTTTGVSGGEVLNATSSTTTNGVLFEQIQEVSTTTGTSTRNGL